jgi:hypothetical protein
MKIGQVRERLRNQKEKLKVQTDEGEELEGVSKCKADEGERILTLIEQMEKEEDEAILVDMEKDDSDEEGHLVPPEWSQTGLCEYSVPNA